MPQSEAKFPYFSLLSHSYKTARVIFQKQKEKIERKREKVSGKRKEIWPFVVTLLVNLTRDLKLCFYFVSSAITRLRLSTISHFSRRYLPFHTLKLFLFLCSSFISGWLLLHPLISCLVKNFVKCYFFHEAFPNSSVELPAPSNVFLLQRDCKVLQSRGHIIVDNNKCLLGFIEFNFILI